MFGKKRQYRKLADQIGKEIHRQLQQAFKEKDEMLGTVSEMVFTAGYLESFTFVAFSEIGCQEIDVHLKYIRHFCNGVLPNRLWEVFERGKALNDLSQGGDREEFVKTRESYDLGVKAGMNDADQFFHKSNPPRNLANFLAGNSVEGTLI